MTKSRMKYTSRAAGSRLLTALFTVVIGASLIGMNGTIVRAAEPEQEQEQVQAQEQAQEQVQEQAPVPAQEKPPLTAAFVRGGALWVKVVDDEKQLTQAEHVVSPKWSYDGKWLAYAAGEQSNELWMLEVSTGAKHLVAANGGRNYKWSPNRLLLAFEEEQRLYVVDQQEATKPVDVSSSIGNMSSYAWRPDGAGFVVSTQGTFNGQTPVRIMQLAMQPDMTGAGSVQAKQLYVLPSQLNELPVVGTSVFKWSASGKWMAFLAIPTASLSADSNTLCVLAADGSVFKPVDQMVNHANWIQWSPQGDELAYIGGIGREATTNKQLRVTRVPDIQPRNDFTPAGFVDQDFTWRSPVDIVVSRAKASEGTDSSGKRPYPYLVSVKLDGERQKRITKSAEGYGDFGPVSLGTDGLGWVRSNRSMANVLVAPPGQGENKAVQWIENIDIGTNYYEQWNWNSVLKFFGK
ncbi:hypothetical protein SAMN05428962_5245 [Paenibacillus sp. BC26]|nr:hypothetical protein SAMN05428962_5245 [Paenibacillus sp. BC26]